MLRAGALLTLIHVCTTEDAKDPSRALDALWVRLPWLEDDLACADELRGINTPPNVLPFCATGGDGNHFWLPDPGRGRVPRGLSVVAVFNGEEPEVVARDLKAFLGLVAVAFAEVVGREMSDAEWRQVRQEWYVDDPETIREMERLSEILLRGVPGVRLPDSPHTVANELPAGVLDA